MEPREMIQIDTKTVPWEERYSDVVALFITNKPFDIHYEGKA